MTKCSICIHERRAEIEAQIVSQVSVRDIAGRFGVSKSSVGRHRSGCMAELVDRAVDLVEDFSAEQIVESSLRYKAEQEKIAKTATRKGNLFAAIYAWSAAQKINRDLAAWLIKGKELLLPAQQQQVIQYVQVRPSEEDRALMKEIGAK